MNKEILSNVISAVLHTLAERALLIHKEITDTAAALRNSLAPVYPVTDREWEDVLRGVARYADCLI